MSKRFLYIFLAFSLFLLSGCRPSGVLSPGQMEDVLYDMHRAEGILQAANLANGHDREEDACYALVLEKNGVTQAQFDSSLVWYTANPMVFNMIYPRVVERLEADAERVREQGDDDQLVREQEESRDRSQEWQELRDILASFYRPTPPIIGWKEPLQEVTIHIPFQLEEPMDSVAAVDASVKVQAKDIPNNVDSDSVAAYGSESKAPASAKSIKDRRPSNIRPNAILKKGKKN